MLKSETIIYFGPEPWKGLWRNRHQLMSRFARQNDVYYVEPPTNIRDCLKRGRPNKLFTRDATGVTVIHGVRWLPLTGRPPMRDISIRIFLGVIALLSGTAFRKRKPIVWLSKPEMLDYVDHLKAKRKVYHVVDEYSGYGHTGNAASSEPNARELGMLRGVDTAIVVTATLYESKSPFNTDTHIVENAVNFEAYADQHLARPYDMADISGPVIGYSGLVAARLDLGMIIDAASARPDWNFVFVGTVNEAYCKAELAQLRALPNVYLLGTKDVDQVPRYVQHFDVCMIPYKLNLRAQHASPLKLYEYAAASRPIVSTDFPAARAFNGHVRFAGSTIELIAACEAALGLDATSEEIVENRRLASENTWEHRVEQLSGILGHTPQRATAATRPHILYVAEFSTGGSIESLLTLIGGLDKDTFRPTVLFHTMPDATVCKRIEAAGADFIAMFPQASYAAASRELRKHNLQAKVRRLFGRRIEYAYASLKFALQYVRFRLPSYRAIRDQLRTIQPDLVHFNTTVITDTTGIHAARTCGIPAVSHVRDFGDVTYPSVLISGRVHTFICISEAVRDFLADRGVDRSRCVVVPNAVDLERFDEAETASATIREEFGWRASDKVVALVGRVVAWKGQDYFIRAIAEARETDDSIRGVIVGDDSGAKDGAGYVADLKALIEELGVADSVRFTGHRSDIPEIMKSADTVVCASSDPEPFGRVIIESMAVGTPVVATDSGGATDIITNNENGLLVPIRDSSAMAAAILRLAKDSELCESIREAALQSVADHYTVANHVDRITRIYRDVLELEQP